MKAESATASIFWGAFLLVMTWDLIMVIRTGLRGTITNHLWTLTRSHPIVAVLWGIVCGHLFRSIDPMFHVGLSIIVLLYFPYAFIRYGYQEAMKKIWENTLLGFVVGLLVGLYFWGETDYGK